MTPAGLRALAKDARRTAQHLLDQAREYDRKADELELEFANDEYPPGFDEQYDREPVFDLGGEG